VLLNQRLVRFCPAGQSVLVTGASFRLWFD
jgi:hypothetical protein